MSAAKPPIRVLVVDDYPDSAESVAGWLALDGFETQVAHDGESALIQASLWHPQVCIVDLGMPKLDGFGLAQRLREESWADGTVLIAHTGYTASEVRHRALQAGFDHYLTKPAEPQEFLRVIENRARRNA